MLRQRLTSLLLGVLKALPVAGLLSLLLNGCLSGGPLAVFEAPQPATVNYRSFDPYKLVVLEGPVKWTDLAFPHRYELFVGKAADTGAAYGHRVDFSFHPGNEAIEAHIQHSRVVWDTAGVTFHEASGHRLFIPRRMFVGGR